MRKFLYSLFLASLLFHPALAIESVEIIFNPSNSPLEIVAYKANYQDSSSHSRQGIRHWVTYKNRSTRTIVALEIGLVSFDVFNRFLDSTFGIDIETVGPGGEENGVWIATVSSDFAFLTGVAFPSKVRFLTGEIWEIDEGELLEKLREIDGDFDLEKLTPGD